MVEKIIIAHLYNPGSAATNRIIAYAYGYQQIGVSVFLVLGCEGGVEEPHISDIDNHIVKSTSHRSLSRRMAGVVKRKYVKGLTAIQIYGTPELCIYLPKSKYNIFYECTEVPFYGAKGCLAQRMKESFRLWATRRATGMMVISKALKEYYHKKGIHNIEIVNMFVDSSRFNIKQEDSRQDYIGYCGKVSLYKDGVDTLIRAFSILHRKFPSLELWIIGGFESQRTETELRSLTKELRINDYVRFVGAVSPTEMPALLYGAKALTLARPENIQAKYGFPTKLGEYLATGKPVVVTNVGEIGDFLKDGINCKIAVPDDYHDFAEKLSWIFENYDEALVLGSRGRELTKSAFSSVEQCKVALSFMNKYSLLDM